MAGSVAQRVRDRTPPRHVEEIVDVGLGPVNTARARCERTANGGISGARDACVSAVNSRCEAHHAVRLSSSAQRSSSGTSHAAPPCTAYHAKRVKSVVDGGVMLGRRGHAEHIA